MKLDPNRPKVPDVKPLVRAYSNKPENIAGGALHLVLDDGNIDDASIDLCIESALAAGDAEAVTIGRLLRRMSKTQRRKATVGL